MFDKWLVDTSAGNPAPLIALQMLTDSGQVDQDDVVDYLGHELLRNYVASGELATIFDDLGVPEVADHLVKHKFPTEDRIRRGEFGEALTGALFRRVRRWCVPILKLRFKQRPNQPVQGVDTLAFRLRATPPVVAVPEVKTQTTKRLNIGTAAQKSLDKVLADLPSSITFVVARLVDRGSALARHIARLLHEDHHIERHIVLVHEDAQWDGRIIDRLTPVVTEHTEVTVIRLPDLRRLVTETYAAAASDPTRAAGRPPAAKGARDA
jgi:hypothetical protein